MFSIEILIVLLTIAAAIMVGVVVYTFVRNKLSPLRRTYAVVGRKWVRDWDVDIPTGFSSFAILISVLGSRPNQPAKPVPLPHDDTLCSATVACVYLVSFRVDGKELEFAVPEVTYIDLQEGDRGVLTYKGEAFKEFVRDAGGPEVTQGMPSVRTREIDRTQMMPPKDHLDNSKFGIHDRGGNDG